jgi:flagellar biosynthesis protein FlhF
MSLTVDTFAAPTVSEALARVRARLGEEAVIVEVRQGAHGAEVDAARTRPLAGLRRLLGSRAEAAPPARRSGQDLTSGALAGPGKHSGRGAALRVLAGPGRASPVAGTLMRLEFPPDLAAKITTIAGRDRDAWSRILAWLERVHPTCPPTDHDGRPTVLGFLGGRGTGRTTLVRGLAARAAVDQPGRIVWLQVGFPARRAMPIDELLAPLGVDHRIANHPAEVAGIASEHGDVSAVLVDLPGIDLAHGGEQRSLSRYLRACRAAWPQVVWNAVVPATWSLRGAVRSVKQQAGLGAIGVAWTWLDRVEDPATILAATIRTGLPPSFLHGDPEGDGDSSRVARWEELVTWLKEPEADQERATT